MIDISINKVYGAILTIFQVLLNHPKEVIKK